MTKVSHSSFLLLAFLSFHVSICHSTDTIREGDMLTEDETLISEGGIFELGFFVDGFSGNYYLGIWLKNDGNKKPIWVANRENPIWDSTGVLQIRHDGNLILIDKRQTPIIVNSGSLATGGDNSSATLLDSGNLVLKQGDEVIWQSFDFPADSWLPGMKLGWFRLNTAVQPWPQVLVSWVSPKNPTRGTFTLAVNRSSYRTLGVWRRDRAHIDFAIWDGRNLRFTFNYTPRNCNFTYVSNENETYFKFNNVRNDSLTWYVITSTGLFDEYTMSNGRISSLTYSVCEESSATGKGSKCITSIPSMCKDGDDFTKMNGTMPTYMLINGSINMGISDCELMCRNNCSCVAFASLQDDQTGCQMFFGNKNHLLDVIEKGVGVVYVRGRVPKAVDDKRKRRLVLIIVLSLASISVLVLASLMHYFRKIKHNSKGIKMAHIHEVELNRENEQELPLFSFASIETATNYFAAANKLGEGGFGPVYKGKMQQGQEIAVKRLSKISRQGIMEFRNEVTLICKLQHRNLVRLLGCCIEGEESILIYEYMPNNSLDSFIFDSTKRELLDWRIRVNIIEGIAQGLLYLHKFSRLRIIHRDLKTSNILLDTDMNPKISDFGMARIFGEKEGGMRTNRIVGTYGYMSPEYAMDGLFSEKSDIFSFGVIVLEIVSGKKNIAFFNCDHSLNLPGKAWNLWKEGKCMDLIDSTLRDSCFASEVLKIVQLGLLCAQERATDRPTIAEVVSLLSMETMALPYPKQPAFLISQFIPTAAESSSSRQGHFSGYDLTISEIYAR